MLNRSIWAYSVNGMDYYGPYDSRTEAILAGVCARTSKSQNIYILKNLKKHVVSELYEPDMLETLLDSLEDVILEESSDGPLDMISGLIFIKDREGFNKELKQLIDRYCVPGYWGEEQDEFISVRDIEDNYAE